jgi:hypothetical protein
MNTQSLNSEDAVNLEGLPTEYYRLEQCQIELDWTAYAQE